VRIRARLGARQQQLGAARASGSDGDSKRRIACSASPSSGTDDLRESPLLELAERLLGKGFELRIHDPAVQLSKLHGSNRAFLEERLPHISRLLCERLESALADAEVVVIGHGASAYRRDEEWRAQGKIVVRLV
jgi:GDP-mannose 6-dehydrogenase